MVFCQKASSNHYANVNYLGRYIKRPSIADSKLKHYAGNNFIFKYLDHKTDTYLETSLSVFDFIGRLIQHIPDVNFRMIRYYGILANRVRSKLIPILYKFLGKTTEKAQLILPSYSSLLISNFNLNPMIYSKCNNHMIHVLAIYRNTASHTLLGYHNHLYGSTFC
ncbi:Transposase for insertion sequence element IS801 [Rickettsiales endosymbiont of Trichoplax sp. H2]|nr:Transposase for insertion sequence element IS801 [Rickettsiales endosymbiont of Trichoplax sp. H2]